MQSPPQIDIQRCAAGRDAVAVEAPCGPGAEASASGIPPAARARSQRVSCAVAKSEKKTQKHRPLLPPGSGRPVPQIGKIRIGRGLPAFSVPGQTPPPVAGCPGTSGA
jgi:hypothetical protein